MVSYSKQDFPNKHNFTCMGIIIIIVKIWLKFNYTITITLHLIIFSQLAWLWFEVMVRLFGSIGIS